MFRRRDPVGERDGPAGDVSQRGDLHLQEHQAGNRHHAPRQERQPRQEVEHHQPHT